MKIQNNYKPCIFCVIPWAEVYWKFNTFPAFIITRLYSNRQEVDIWNVFNFTLWAPLCNFQWLHSQEWYSHGDASEVWFVQKFMWEICKPLHICNAEPSSGFSGNQPMIFVNSCRPVGPVGNMDQLIFLLGFKSSTQWLRDCEIL